MVQDVFYQEYGLANMTLMRIYAQEERVHMIMTRMKVMMMMS